MIRKAFLCSAVAWARSSATGYQLLVELDLIEDRAGLRHQREQLEPSPGRLVSMPRS